VWGGGKIIRLMNASTSTDTCAPAQSFICCLVKLHYIKLQVLGSTAWSVHIRLFLLWSVLVGNLTNYRDRSLTAMTRAFLGHCVAKYAKPIHLYPAPFINPHPQPPHYRQMPTKAECRREEQDVGQFLKLQGFPPLPPPPPHPSSFTPCKTLTEVDAAERSRM